MKWFVLAVQEFDIPVLNSPCQWNKVRTCTKSLSHLYISLPGFWLLHFHLNCQHLSTWWRSVLPFKPGVAYVRIIMLEWNRTNAKEPSSGRKTIQSRSLPKRKLHIQFTYNYVHAMSKPLIQNNLNEHHTTNY